MDWSILLAILGLAVLIGFGYFTAALLLPSSLCRLRLALAPGIGAGICSIIFFAFRRPVFTVEGALTLLVVLLLWRRGWKVGGAGWQLSSGTAGVLALVLPAATWACSGMVTRVIRMPHGDWDGWAIWNWEARLLVRAGSHWRDGLLLAFHGDYPLLIPGTTARFLRYAGADIAEAGVGAWLGVLLGLCAAAVLGLALSELRGRWLGITLALTVLGTPFFLDIASSQYADVPVSFFFVGCLALLAIHFEREPGDLRIVALAGFLAGCAAWTKNEGILFVAAVASALLFPLLRERKMNLRRIAAFCAGSALPVLVVVIFKLSIVVQNYLIANQNNTIPKLLDPARHVMILTHIRNISLLFGRWSFSPFIPLLFLVLLTGVNWKVIRSRSWLTVGAILLMVAAGYYAVYLTTPLDLQWHLDSSMERLMVQMWPSVLLFVGLCCRERRSA